MTTSASWFYMRGDQQHGPVTLDDLRRLCRGDGRKPNGTRCDGAGGQFGDRGDIRGIVCGGVVAGVGGDSAVPVAAGVAPGTDRQGETVTAGAGGVQCYFGVTAASAPTARARRRACSAWMTAGISEITMIARITTWKWVLTQEIWPKR